MPSAASSSTPPACDTRQYTRLYTGQLAQSKPDLFTLPAPSFPSDTRTSDIPHSRHLLFLPTYGRKSIYEQIELSSESDLSSNDDKDFAFRTLYSFPPLPHPPPSPNPPTHKHPMLALTLRAILEHPLSLSLIHI